MYVSQSPHQEVSLILLCWYGPSIWHSCWFRASSNQPIKDRSPQGCIRWWWGVLYFSAPWNLPKTTDCGVTGRKQKVRTSFYQGRQILLESMPDKVWSEQHSRDNKISKSLLVSTESTVFWHNQQGSNRADVFPDWVTFCSSKNSQMTSLLIYWQSKKLE